VNPVKLGSGYLGTALEGGLWFFSFLPWAPLYTIPCTLKGCNISTPGFTQGYVPSHQNPPPRILRGNIPGFGLDVEPRWGSFLGGGGGLCLGIQGFTLGLDVEPRWGSFLGGGGLCLGAQGFTLGLNVEPRWGSFLGGGGLCLGAQGFTLGLNVEFRWGSFLGGGGGLCLGAQGFTLGLNVEPRWGSFAWEVIGVYPGDSPRV